MIDANLDNQGAINVTGSSLAINQGIGFYAFTSDQ